MPVGMIATGTFHTNGQNVIANWGVVNAGGTLYIDGGSLTINGASGLLTGNTVGGGAGNVIMSSGALSTPVINMGLAGTFNASFAFSGGTITTSALSIQTAASTFTCSNSPVLNINGNLTNAGTFTTLTSGAPAITITGSLTNSGNITNAASSSPDMVITGDVINSGTLTTSANATISLKGNWSNSGTSVANGGAVTFNGVSNQTIGGSSATTFNNLIINPSSGITVSLVTNNISILKNLTVSSGIFNLGTLTCNRSTPGGTLSVASGATLKLAGASGGATGSNFPNNFTTNTLNANSTVEYNGSVAQTIYDSPTYGNLTLSTGNTKTAGGNLTVAGDLAINTTATFAGSSFIHSIGGNWYNNVSSTAFDRGTSEVAFNGSVAQSIGGTAGTSFYSIVVANSAGVGISAATPVDVFNSLEYSGIGSSLTTNDNLTLKSTATNTAWIGDITGNTITGK